MAMTIAADAGILDAAYKAKDSAYYDGARADMVAHLPDNPNAAILEIGCGTGATGRLALALGKCGRYAGVELFESAAREARGVLSEVVVGDVERIALPWERETFDALILSEVLEHLVAPWNVVARIAPLVRPGGLVMASSPNVSQYRVIAALLRGRFDLADKGVFDRTHLRWFTPRTFAAMFEEAGFSVEHIGPVVPFAARTRLISALSGGRLDHLFTRQINLRACKR